MFLPCRCYYIGIDSTYSLVSGLVHWQNSRFTYTVQTLRGFSNYTGSAILEPYGVWIFRWSMEG